MFSRSSHRRCSITKDVLRNFAKFTRKHLCQSLFFNKVAGNFIKKETLAQVFSFEFCEISKNTFFTEHLRITVSGFHGVYKETSSMKCVNLNIMGNLPVSSCSEAVAQMCSV